jgi:hypothetical protein
MHPPEFIRGLRELFDLYAYRVYRPGQSLPPASRLPANHIPPLVIIQLQTSLRPECSAHPVEALDLIDALWAEAMLEPRILAADLLGQILIASSAAVMQRLQRWGTPAEDRPVLQALFASGTTTLRRQSIQAWLSIIITWLNTSDQSVQAVGLLALLPLVNDPQFENLPAIFTAVSPLLQSAPPVLLSDLQDLLEACLRRSPIETGYFLRQLLMMTTAPGLTRLVRRIFSQLPPATQVSLRDLLQSREEK